MPIFRWPRDGRSAALAGLRLQASAIARLLSPVFRFVVIAIVVMTASRLFLAWLHSERLSADGSLATVMMRGWRFDLVVISGACLVAVLVQWLAPSRVLGSTGWRVAVNAWLSAWLMLIVFDEAATPDFIAEFGVRPNRLFVEYLDTPREIFWTIIEAHGWALLAGVAVTLAAGFLGARLMRVRSGPTPPWPLRVLVFVPLVIGLFYGLRGSTGHRPMNASFAALSTDPLVNELPLNSTYTVLHALVQMWREDRTITAYGNMEEAEVVRRIRAGMQLPADAFPDRASPTEHVLLPTASRAGKPNLVILLQEGLGARFVASLGGAPVATSIESWRGRSLWFDELYATGTRSARGMEAISSGFPPTRARSVIKLADAQHDFFTLASALKGAGYHTEFVYGGDSTFDNMRRFLLGNGIDRVVDWSDLAPAARFKTTWGVSDEDLYAWVHERARALEETGRPFFLFVFSTSNHPPYDFPDGRIALVEQPKMTPNNAARYADFSVGRYLDVASRSSYWADTLFMVTADHESKLIGEGLVPVFSYHIPGFFAGGPVRPRVIGRIASQIDLLPTALSLMGQRLAVPAIGIDQSRDDIVGPGRAVMQFHDNAAYRVGNDVVMLVPGMAPQQFGIRGGVLVPEAADFELVGDAMAYAQWPVMAYLSGWYH